MDFARGVKRFEADGRFGRRFAEGSEWVALAILLGTACVLQLANLGNQYLWQDEAQTALLAKTILSHGIPKGSDGRNYFSQELGIEYGESYVWKWHPWLSFYLVAGSFRLFGTDTLAARLPFALFGIATVVLAYFAARSLWGNRPTAEATGVLLAVSVPFLILSRQCRWYGLAAFFALLSLWAYTLLRPESRRPSLLLFVAATLLFHTHYLYCGTLLVTLLLHAAIFDRAKLRSVGWVSAAVVAVNLPWIAWFATIRYAENYADRMADLGQSFRYALRYLRLMDQHFFDARFLLIPVGLAAWRWWKREPVLEISPEIRRNIWLIALFCAVNVVALALASPGAYVRYLTPLAPALAVLAGLLVGSLLRRSLVAGAAVLGLWIASGSIGAFLYEITHDFDGPIEGIVKFLRTQGEPGDTVAITYGDLPLKFYTEMRVVGGLTGEDLSEAADADWIILRRHHITDEDERVRAELRKHLTPEKYGRYQIDYPDTGFENREDPYLHRFRTSPLEYKVEIYGKLP